MADINRIIEALDKFLEDKNKPFTTLVEITPYLESKGLLKDSKTRPGLPIRRLLRKGKIPHCYQIGTNWIIPHSGNRSRNLESVQKGNIVTDIKTIKNTNNRYKLEPIGNLIIELLEEKFGETPNLKFEYKPDWLLSYPNRELIESCLEIGIIYAKLTDGKFSIKEKIEELTQKKLKQKQSFDIWIGEPFNFGVEFDEKQHFNQFRKITLDHYHSIAINFPIPLYIELNRDAQIKPSTSGFTRLKSSDPLFPEMLEGEKQDNRIRQRAFRDFLKDILPVKNGCNPTLRIPYQVVNRQINNFNEHDFSKIKDYLINSKLLNGLSPQI